MRDIYFKVKAHCLLFNGDSYDCDYSGIYHDTFNGACAEKIAAEIKTSNTPSWRDIDYFYIERIDCNEETRSI